MKLWRSVPKSLATLKEAFFNGCDCQRCDFLRACLVGAGICALLQIFYLIVLILAAFQG